MKAAVIYSFGHEDQIKLADLPEPVPGPHEILVKVAYASVNPVDWKIRKGLLKDRLPHQFPIVLGWDASGTIKALGAEVRDFQVGDRVYAYCRKPTVQWGTYAEYIALDEQMVAKLPSSLSFAQAAAVPLVGLTAWQCLQDAARLKSGETVLIHAGSGGVGGMAIQFAKSLGAGKIFTTASKKNHPYVLELGAHRAIDYRGENFVDIIRKECPDGIDVVLETIGGQTEEQSYRVLRKGGRLVGIVAPPDTQMANRFGVETHYVFVQPNGAQLSQISDLFNNGEVKPLEIEEMPLEQVALAHLKSEEHHVRGKIVLKI